jgi:hypothetical protein
MRGKLDYLELREGGRYWFDPCIAQIELFGHAMRSAYTDYKGEPRPDPPEILRALAGAKDRKAALERFYPARGSMLFYTYDLEALFERGELVPRSFMAGGEVGE